MASRPSAEELRKIRLAVREPKIWVAGDEIGWVLNGAGPPPGYKFRAPLSFKASPGVQSAELFISGYYKESSIPGVAPKLSFGLFYQGYRVLGIDDGPPSSHFNKVGEGLPYYQMQVGHPQLHLVADDAVYGYAEPLENGSPQSFWELFLTHSSISNAPEFKLPEVQLELDV